MRPYGTPAAPERPAAGRPSSACGTAATGSPRPAPSPWLPVGADSASPGPSIPTTSDARKSFGSLRHCADTSPPVSRSSGTDTAPTGQRMSRPGWPPGSGSSSSGCRPMPQTSILWNASGATPSTGIWRTSPPTVSVHLSTPSLPLFHKREAGGTSSKGSFTAPDSNNKLYHYLCKGQ